MSSRREFVRKAGAALAGLVGLCAGKAAAEKGDDIWAWASQREWAIRIGYDPTFGGHRLHLCQLGKSREDDILVESGVFQSGRADIVLEEAMRMCRMRREATGGDK